MRIKLLIATSDSDYTEHLSNVLSESYADTFEVSVCSSSQRLAEVLISNKYDAVLIEPTLIASVNANSARLLLMLSDGTELVSEQYKNIKRISKYQRILSLTANVLESCAETGLTSNGFDSEKARITAVWSPAGGVGKTAIALAYAARKVSEGKQALYLDLGNFSSISTYFTQNGKSISFAFEKLESHVNILLRSIRQQDKGSGIMYFGEPDNYDDINILTVDDISVLTSACASGVDELVIDLPSVCDARVQKIFELADAVLLVCDASKNAQMKLQQFMNQHNVSQHIQSKAILVCNKGAKISESRIAKSIQLPFVQSADAIVVYKTLSGHSFER